MKPIAGILVSLALLSVAMELSLGQTAKRGGEERGNALQGASVLSTVWQIQSSNLPLGKSEAGFSAVSNRVCWAIGWSDDGVTPYNGYIRTTDGGNSWVCDSIPGAENGLQSQVEAIDADTAYVVVFVQTSSSSKGVYKTTNGGANWTKQNAYSSSLYGPGLIHFFDAKNGVVVGDPNLETYTTSDGGRNWNPVSMPAALSGEYTWVGGPGMAGVGNHVWFGTGARIFRSSDRGYTWSATAAEAGYINWHPLLAFQDTTNGISALKKSADTPHLYRKTTDGGVTWNVLTDPVLDKIAPTGLLHLPGTKATYLVSGGLAQGMRGFACTFNGGANWSLIDTGGVWDLGFPSDSVGWGDDPWGNRIFKYIGARLVTSITEGSVTPASFVLAQNYPNPFNPSTTISYELPKSSHVSLTVYDVLGREVSVLVNERRDAGLHEVRFDGSNLASGVYFYRLQAGDYVASKKMLVLK